MVSIVILTRNRAALLEQALRSALAQTLQPIEIIVVDNASTDGTRELVARYAKNDSRIRYHLFAAPGQICAARNAGAQMASGAYVAFLDDDDWWQPNKLERQVTLLEQHPEAALVYAWARMVDASGQFLGLMPPQPSANTYRELCEADFIGGVSVALMRTQTFLQAGGFRPSMAGAEDYDLWIRLSRRGRIMAVEEPLIIHLRQPRSFSRDHLRSALAHSQALLQADPSMGEGVTRSWLRKRAATLRYSAASHMMEQRQFVRAAATFLHALWLHPCVGLSVSWSKHPGLAYRVLKPVMAAGYCLVRGCVSSMPERIVR